MPRMPAAEAFFKINYIYRGVMLMMRYISADDTTDKTLRHAAAQHFIKMRAAVVKLSRPAKYDN